ncbi:MAG: transketolase [Endomicrobia bacterium]|nr:transketolase [Endomicrobiia bacterium]
MIPNDIKSKTMRDVLIEEVYKKMKENRKIIFLSDDFGAPSLDKLRIDFNDRFINVGIAEQNLISIASGLALEGFVVYAYGIASFMTMRCFEQIRVCLSQMAQVRDINVNIVGVGAGISYDISGPAHHSYEDVTLMRSLPNLVLFSPSDNLLTKKFVDFSVKIKQPKYLRLDSKPLQAIYNKNNKIDFKKGFYELKKSKGICIVSTGYMTHKALAVAAEFEKEKIDIGIVDIFILNPIDQDALVETLKKYDIIITLAEEFINRGGLDSLITFLLMRSNKTYKLINLGFDKYVFSVGSREYLHRKFNLGKEDILKLIKKFC